MLGELLEFGLFRGEALWAVDDVEFVLELKEGVMDDLADVLDFSRTVGKELEMAPELVEELLAEHALLFAHLVHVVYSVLSIE